MFSHNLKSIPKGHRIIENQSKSDYDEIKIYFDEVIKLTVYWHLERQRRKEQKEFKEKLRENLSL